MDAAAPDADEPATATDHRAYLAQRYFPSLDGVPAVAVIFVYSGHAIYTDFWGVFYGGNGVNVFFALSGFLITTLALREEGRRGRLSPAELLHPPAVPHLPDVLRGARAVLRADLRGQLRSRAA